MKSYRNDVLQFAKKQYGTEPEYLWMSAPNYAVLRHEDNRKWYALIMNVPKNRLGLDGEEEVDILDIKVDPVIGGSLLAREGIMSGYHMNKGHWITVLLDGTVDKETIFFLLEMSFDITAKKKTKKQKNGT